MKAVLSNYRQSPRKVRLVANLIKGKSVERALSEIEMLPRRASLPLKKLLLSAVANAKAQGGGNSKLVISDIRVDKGIVLKRFIPRARGVANRINRRRSNIRIFLKEAASENK